MMKDGRAEPALFKPFVIYYKPSTFPMKHFYQSTWFVRKNIDFLIGRTILIRTDNAAKSFYALSHIYALRIEMVDVIFVQTKH